MGILSATRATVRGSIRDRAAYIREKMIDHSGWNGVLPRAITPSDIDAVLDNDGAILFIEMSGATSDWNEYPDGQHRLYRNLVRNGGGRQLSVLCKHTTEPGKDIDTLRNVTEFTVIYRSEDDVMAVDGLQYRTYVGNSAWREFVVQFFRGQYPG